MLPAFFSTKLAVCFAPIITSQSLLPAVAVCARMSLLSQSDGVADLGVHFIG